MVLAFIGLMAALAIPALGPLLARRSLDAAAAVVAGEIARVRHEAVAKNRYVGLRFEAGPGGGTFAIYEDGGRKGIHAAEILSGADRLLRGPATLSSRFPGVRFGIPGPSPIPRIPPSRGRLMPGSDPIQFGSSDILSFSPIGEATSGTLYLTDRREGLRAVVVYGRTGRVRVWRYVPGSQVWRQ